MIHHLLPTATLRICQGLSCGCKAAISFYYTLVSSTYEITLPPVCKEAPPNLSTVSPSNSVENLSGSNSLDVSCYTVSC